MAGDEARIVIVGAGQAGGRAAEALRAAGHRGSVTVIGSECHPPYERPQLSKAVVLDRAVDAMYLKADWSSLGVQLLTGVTVVDCEHDQRRIGLQDGRTLDFDKLLLATGTRPRRLRFLETGPVPIHYLRDIDDAYALRAAFRPDARIAIVGGGVIGLEAAAAAVSHGCAVAIVELADRLLARALPPVVSRYIEARHREHGVAFRFGTAPAGSSERGLELVDGTSVAADIILVGIGVDPVTEIADRLGLGCKDGIRVDAAGRTDAPGIFAAGDVALQWSRCHDRWLRVETWANAQNQAICAARNMAGNGTQYQDPPWFWSDQYNFNLQVVGDCVSDDLVVRGDPDEGPFSVICLRAGEVIGGATLKAPRDMAAIRRLVGADAQALRADLENPAFDLRRAIRRN